VEGLGAAEAAAEVGEKHAPKKPALLKGGMILCWINAGVLLLYLWALPSLAAGDIQKNVIIGERGVGDGQIQTVFLTDFAATSQLFIIALLALSIVVAYGLAKDRHWSRWVMMMLLVLGIVLLPGPFANAINYGLSIALAGFGWWYLYKKPNVVEYYRVIRKDN
jgi:hypothetical protein